VIYETIDRADLEPWILSRQGAEAPPIWELAPPYDVYDRVLGTDVGELKEILHFRSDSGAIEVSFERLAQFSNEQMSVLALRVADACDTREFYRWEDLDEEEAGAPKDVRRIVSDELWGAIDGVRPIGPGGRITVYGPQRKADIVVRHRVRRLGGVWKPPAGIVDTVDTLLDDETPKDVRLRAAFGYFEASKYEQQRYLRPAFVFLLDRFAAREGPRWRVATVTAATTGDVPPTAGLEAASRGCV
jgi:hypothetical protein